MFFLCTVYTDEGEYYRYVASTGSEFHAARLVRNHANAEGLIVEAIDTEVFDTFEHGDPDYYEIVTASWR